MADVYVNALTTISTEPSSTDSIVCVNRNTNEGQIIDYELLADKILDKLANKNFSSLNTTSKKLVGAINEQGLDLYTLNQNFTNAKPTLTKWQQNIAASDITLNNWTTFTSFTRTSGYLGLSIVKVSFSGSAGRYVITQSSGLQSECTQSGTANAVTGLNLLAYTGDGGTTNVQYYFTVRPSTAVSVYVERITWKIS